MLHTASAGPCVMPGSSNKGLCLLLPRLRRSRFCLVCTVPGMVGLCGLALKLVPG